MNPARLLRTFAPLFCIGWMLPGCETGHGLMQNSAYIRDLANAARTDADCHAPPDPSRPQYIVGYGSLMQDESRSRTSPKAGPAHPIELAGYKRGWFARPDTVSMGFTALGVVPDAETRLNGVIYQVEPEELLATDQREFSYCRNAVAMASLRLLEKAFTPAANGQVWIYVNTPRNVAPPDARHPIVESYVDIFVSGCLEQEQRFALKNFSRQCVATTSGWSEHWVNDRIYPRRPFIHQPKARQIDGVLSTEIPEYFFRIRIDSGN